MLKALAVATMLLSLAACRTADSALKDGEPEPVDPAAPVDPNVAKYKQFKPLKCASSKATLFKKGAPETPKHIAIKTNFDAVFSQSSTAYGVIMNIDATDPLLKFIPVYTEKRGNSRGTYCELKPLRFTYLLQPKEDAIRQKLVAAGVDLTRGVTPEAHAKIMEDMTAANLPGDAEKLQFYYDRLIAAMQGQPTPAIGFPQDSTSMFFRTGDDIKFVTHCGKTTWPELSGLNYHEQRKRLLGEFYLYRIVDEFKSTFIKTSIADVSYYPHASNEPMDFEGNKAVVSFFRESKSRMADRCDLKSEPPTPGQNFPANKVSVTQAEFVNNLLDSLDFVLQGNHNTESIYSASESYYSPYDYDLAGVLTDTYFKNAGDWPVKRARFKQFLAQRLNNEFVIAQVMNFLGKLPKVKVQITQGEKAMYGAEENPANRLSRWLTEFEPELRAYIEANRAANGPYIAAIEALQAAGGNADNDENNAD